MAALRNFNGLASWRNSENSLQSANLTMPVIDRLTQETLGEVFLTPLPIDAEDTQWELIHGDDLPDGEIEIGYLFKRSTWGKGVATEACQRLLRFAFEETPLTEIVGVIEEGNAASENVLLKCGFVREGMRRAYAEQRPAFRITREQFMARSSPDFSNPSWRCVKWS